MRCPNGAERNWGLGSGRIAGVVRCVTCVCYIKIILVSQAQSQRCTLWWNGTSGARDISPQRFSISDVCRSETEANMGRATAGASQIYCVVRGWFSVVITEENQVQRPRSVFFNIFSFLIILLKNFIIIWNFYFFVFLFPRGVRGELEKEKHLIKEILAFFLWIVLILVLLDFLRFL